MFCLLSEYKAAVPAAAARPDKDMGLRLGRELLDAAEGRGGAIKKKLDMMT